MSGKMERWGTREEEADATVFLADVPIATALTYLGRVVPGAHQRADADVPYVLINRSVYAWDLELSDASGVLLRLMYSDDKDRGLFNNDPDMFLVPPVNPKAYNRVVDAHKEGGLKCSIILKGFYHRLLKHFLDRLRVGDSKRTNFAAPDGHHGKEKLTPAEKAILDSFDLKGSGKRPGQWDFEDEDFRITANCVVLGSEIMFMPAGTTSKVTSGRPTGVKLAVHMHLEQLQGGQPSWDNAVTRLIACDWTSLLENSPKEGIAPDSSQLQRLFLWQKNIASYFLGYASLHRGKEIFEEIVREGQATYGTGGRSTGTKQVRDAVDAFVLTANAFAGVQESPKSEPYQAKLQKLFGSIKKNRVMAAPMAIFRMLRNEAGYTGEDVSHFVLQAGVGHCGEHARLSFEILNSINDALRDPSDAMDIGPFDPIVLAAEAQIDHAFVMVGIPVRRIVPVKLLPKNPHFRGVPKFDENIAIFNLAKAISETLGGLDKGDICDPYLQQHFSSAKTMLNAIKRKGSKFLMFHNITQRGTPITLDPAPPTDAQLKPLSMERKK